MTPMRNMKKKSVKNVFAGPTFFPRPTFIFKLLHVLIPFLDCTWPVLFTRVWSGSTGERFPSPNMFLAKLPIFIEKRKKTTGRVGYRSPYLSHAKRALYHVSYTPCRAGKRICLCFSDIKIIYILFILVSPSVVGLKLMAFFGGKCVYIFPIWQFQSW